MNIKKFSAATMRRALADIRAEMGPEAVIVHTEHEAGRVIVTAATDYDPGMADLIRNFEHTETTVASRAEPAADDPAAIAAAARVLGRDFASRKHGTGTSPASGPADARSTGFHARLDDDFDLNDVTIAANGASDEPATSDEEGPPAGVTAPTGTELQHASSERQRLDDVGAELRALRDLVEQQLNGLAWQNMRRTDPQRPFILQRLLQLGLAPELCTSVANQMPYSALIDVSWAHAKEEVASRFRRTHGPTLLETGGIVALVGPTGAGKTTTIAKLAGQYLRLHGPHSVGLVTTDDYRLGAHEQLQAFARILDLPVTSARDAESLIAAVRGYRGRSLVLIDTEGGADRAAEQQEMLAALALAESEARIYAVIAASMQRASLYKTILRHGRNRLHAAIVTKVDECGTLGDAISALIHAKLPLTYLTDGQQIPQDLHASSADDLLERADALMGDRGQTIDDEVLGMTFGQAAGG